LQSDCKENGLEQRHTKLKQGPSEESVLFSKEKKKQFKHLLQETRFQHESSRGGLGRWALKLSHRILCLDAEVPL
jgi:hypothetical protein